MTSGATLELALRLERLDDLFVEPETLPWSPLYGAHGDRPALEFIADELVSNPAYRHVTAVLEVPVAAIEARSPTQVRAAVARWAAVRVEQCDRAARTSAQRGVRFLLAGLVFFAIAIGLSRVTGTADGEVADTVSRGLEVFAWVVLWFPLDVLVFGMWQQRLDRRAAEAIGRMPIELVSRDS